MLQIQAKITDIIKDTWIPALVILDLSASFEVFDHKLLVNRMSQCSIPSDVIELTKYWLFKREAYVEVNGESSHFFNVPKGTVQGSVFGPVLFSIFVKKKHH